ncbi:monovalent cation/H(+) antiporter subunit G [Aquicoccus sp. G2-2]|uniref:monovalent cation/H(+) antiporter subunit G n=1 Tax=Aquicoccus sp. G2-2 TaxID=3092120 RepID=UPI002AE02F58|nr:monovalent cation/H(+) antiporter subunit G [Aquicoccus sp. G2-2]MEA1112432.1 monovalent cation/H(+) antiporter subunit G [Aquicoccus sp. G2-2]
MSWSVLIVEALSWIFIVAGSGFVIVGAFGAWRLPDFWSRLHAASVTDSAGMILLVAGMCLQAGPTLITVKLIIIGIFLFITGPTATHAVANAALMTGLRPRVADGLVAEAPEVNLDNLPEDLLEDVLHNEKVS